MLLNEEQIVSAITDLPESERRFSDFAILYRAHNHREEFIAALDRRQIPYKVVSGAGLLKNEEIKDISHSSSVRLAVKTVCRAIAPCQLQIRPYRRAA